MARVEFHFDFGSPNAYLAHKVLPAIEARTGAKFAYVPILLGGVFKATNNRSPMEAFAGIRNKPEYEALQTRRFVARHGLDAFRFNPNFPINTLQLMRGAVAAQRLGVFEAYVDAVFRAMWEDQKPMGDPEVFADALRSAGLDAGGLIALSQDPEVKAALVANTEASVARGTFGSPTFFVGDEIYFGKDSLGDVEAAIRAG
jgi:2-hydroxychromene-2-carboxylate isomerase